MAAGMDTNVEAVVEELRRRSAVGVKKYGVDTSRTDLTTLQWLQHAKEEALDFAVYLQRISQDVAASGMAATLGWRCPRCNTVWSPWLDFCDCASHSLASDHDHGTLM